MGESAKPLNLAERALWLFAHEHNCSQAVLKAFGPDLGLSAELAGCVASAFGGGIVRRAEICGAVTGVLMVLGLRHQGNRDIVYPTGQNFIERFQARHGSISCRELLPCDLSTDAGRREAREKGYHASICAGLVRSAVEILEQLG